MQRIFIALKISFRTKKEYLREKLFFYFNLKKSAAESHRLLVASEGLWHALFKTNLQKLN